MMRHAAEVRYARPKILPADPEQIGAGDVSVAVQDPPETPPAEVTDDVEATC